MNGANDREEIKRFLEEQFGAIEESGAVSVVGMTHIAHNGAVQLHAMTGSHGKWGNADAMAFAFDSIATRHARGVSSGGAQQFELAVSRGGEQRQTAVLPFVRVGSGNMIGPNGSLATEPPTQTGMTSQAMRLLEILGHGAFALTKDNIETMRGLIRDLTQRLQETDSNNRELWLSLKNVLMELQKQTHEQRLKEITAQRMAEFQKQVIKFAPALLNMMAGREVFPLSAADTAVIETIAEVVTPDDLRLLQAGLQNKPGGEALAALLADRFEQSRRRKAEERANENRLAQGREPVSYDEAERDAMGLATRALKGQSLEQVPEGLATRAAVKALSTPAPQTNGHVTIETPSLAGDDTKLIDDFFNLWGDKIGVMLGMLEEKDPELARRMRARAQHEPLKKI